MARTTSGEAGASVRRMAWSRMGILIAVLVGLYIVFMLALKNASRLPLGIGLVAAVALLIAMKMAMDRWGRRVDQAVNGAKAEEDIGRKLDQLDERFHVVHDVIVGRGNIDHVVVGPLGITTIETKSHQGEVTFADGRLRINGHGLEKDFLSQSYAEAMALKDYLKKATGKNFYITPLLVFTRAFVKVSDKARGVEVLPAKWLVERLSRGSGERLDEAERARLARALAQLTDQVRREAR